MPYRVLIAQFMHETNTFSKLKTTLDDYRRRWLIDGEEMVPRFKGTRNEVGGYIDQAANYGWEPVYAVAANATPSGMLTKETWETIRDMIVDAWRASADMGVGYPMISVRDIEAGRHILARDRHEVYFFRIDLCGTQHAAAENVGEATRLLNADTLAFEISQRLDLAAHNH